MRVTAPSSAPSYARRFRQGNGTVSTHCRSATVGQDALDEVRRRRGHAPARARGGRIRGPCRAKATTRRSEQSPAFHMGEAAAEQPAVEVPVELLAHEGGERDREGPVVDRPVEGLEVVTHDLVERRGLGSAALVDQARPAPGEDQPDRLRGGVHASSSASSAPDASPCDLRRLAGCHLALTAHRVSADGLRRERHFDEVAHAREVTVAEDQAGAGFGRGELGAGVAGARRPGRRHFAARPARRAA